MIIYLCYFLILLNEIFSSNDKIYRIPFTLFKQQNSESFYNPEKDANIVNNIVNNGKYINLSIGTPSQITPFELDSNSQTFSASNELFNRNKSSTYEQISEKEININFEIAEKGFNSKDILNIDINTNKKIKFILGTKFQSQKSNNFGIIGLKIPYLVQNNISPFFESLKAAGLITSFVWTLKFFDNISLVDQLTYNEEKEKVIGEFIFGEEPSKYENDEYKYNEKEFYKIPPLTTKGHIDWDLEFSNIYLTFKEKNNNNSKIDFLGEKSAEIIINFSFMLGPNYFFDFIKSNFFWPFLSNNVCREKLADYIYSYIECDYSPSFNIASFPDISFEHKGFETIFNLTYKDLFIFAKKTSKYIFLIFTKPYFSDWVLGTIFLRKFQFVFNIDSKTLGYYRPIQQQNESNNKNMMDLNGSRTFKTIIIFILVIIFSFVLVCFGMIIQKKYFNKNRKLRANELEENFSYESRNHNEKNMQINDDKKIIKEENENNEYFSI